MLNLKKNGEKILSTKTNLLVQNVMIDFDNTPTSKPQAILKEVFEIMDNYRLGIVCVIDNSNTLKGIITDGDIRRMLTRVQKPFGALLGDDVINHVIKSPLTVSKKTLLKDALLIMSENQVWDLPVVDGNKLCGLLHLHPAIEAVMET